LSAAASAAFFAFGARGGILGADLTWVFFFAGVLFGAGFFFAIFKIYGSDFL
jgi:hypothetical protein